MVKSIEELRSIKERMKSQVDLRQKDANGTRVVVGMSTCGIAAGAREVLNALVNETGQKGLRNIIVSQTSCTGLCQHEPVVEVYEPGQEKIVYTKMDAQKVAQVVNEHFINHQPVKDYLLS